MQQFGGPKADVQLFIYIDSERNNVTDENTRAEDTRKRINLKGKLIRVNRGGWSHAKYTRVCNDSSLRTSLIARPRHRIKEFRRIEGKVSVWSESSQQNLRTITVAKAYSR